jgi:hypothetical protein
MCKKKAWNEVNECKLASLNSMKSCIQHPNNLGYLAFMAMHHLESMIEKK